ncbi:tripartite tricarboxylate transporter substrate binding protein [Polaromonas sp. SM01]|uniref:Bug family tripartite tricarboxylate transporter substrate binding protein n=1 Tax=Polaromonas sp. SM01 TaxID=3085630 RepID=UPI00298197E0|nr:tripartite tricarboxylate transporter substrate binding protein [Polaromonas sp. SM01]MDW5442161.1 tripartite tricarboxylate transporter substrate binding protein [Polaromonas sp. SM01]
MLFNTFASRRKLLLAALASVCVPVWAQNIKPLKIVVPFAPGGGNDVFARQMAKSLGELRNQSIIVENKPGAGGNLGTEQVVRSAADGATLLLGHSGTVSINPALYKGLKYDPQKDLAPVAMFASSALVLVVPASSSVKTVADLVALAKSKPGSLNYASSGSGTGGHLTGELFEQKSDVKINHIPYKGTAPGLTDLVGGQVQMMFSVIPPALALVKSGRLRAVAVTGSKRAPSMPDVPTIAESGIAGLGGFESTLTYGLLAPYNTPDALVKELSSQILKVAASVEFQSKLGVEGAVPMLGGPADYAGLIRKESAKWAEIVKLSGATVE